MAIPEIQNPVPALANQLALHFGSNVTWGPPPDSIRPKNHSKLNPFTFSDPEPAVDNEPRRW